MAKTDVNNGLCGECGQSVMLVKGHKRNWPHMLVAQSSSIADAIQLFHANVDENNSDFAVPEFAAAMQERFGVQPG